VPTLNEVNNSIGETRRFKPGSVFHALLKLLEKQDIPFYMPAARLGRAA